MPEPRPVSAVTPTSTYVMHWNTVKTQSRIGGATLHSMTMDSTLEHDVLDREMKSLLLSLEAKVLTDQVAKRTYDIEWHVEVYTSWFQHLKAARMRPWILRRWPPKTIKILKTATVSCEHDVTYPEAHFVPESFGRPVRYDRWVRERW